MASAAAVPPDPRDRETGAYITRGTPAFRRAILALFASSFATLALLYCVQPLLPLFAREFGISAAESSLSLSLSTGLLALGMLVASSLSDASGRKPLMVAAVLASAAFTIIGAFVPTWHGLLVVRALTGLALSGLPAVAMAYLSEEIDRPSLGLAMGLLIAGNAFGGMAGRLFTGVLTDLVSWRAAMFTIGALGLIAGIILWRALPTSAHFRPRPMVPGLLVAAFADHVRDAGLPWLFLEAFLLMGGFVATYNYIGYRLLEPPYDLSQTAVGASFAAYLVGMASSAWCGDLAGRLGRRKVLWATIVVMMAGLALTLFASLVAIIAGIAVFTFGFFGAHSVASAWVGARALRAKAQASSLYLFFYYLGGSLVGWVGGFFWTAWAWPGVAALVALLAAAALAISLRLVSLAPVPLSSGQSTPPM